MAASREACLLDGWCCAESRQRETELTRGAVRRPVGDKYESGCVIGLPTGVREGGGRAYSEPDSNKGARAGGKAFIVRVIISINRLRVCRDRHQQAQPRWWAGRP